MKKLCLVFGLLCCALALWMTGCENKTTVTGIVTYKDNSPAAGKVVVAVMVNEYRSFDTHTDSAGRYVFRNADPGEWKIYALREDRWTDDTQTYTRWVKAGQETVLDIKLPETVHLYRVCVDGKWGYIDKTGAIKIEPQFDAAYDFSEGLAVVDVAWDDGSGFGYIDTSGEMVIEQQFASAEAFSEGLAAVGTVDQGDSGKWGSIDRSGALVVPMRYVTPPIFSEGLAAVFAGVDQGWSFIDKTGATVLGPFRSAGNFSEGLAYVDWVDGRGYIDKDGARVIELPQGITSERWPEAGFSEGLAMVKSQEGGVVLTGFIDTSGDWVIEPRFHWAGAFSEGLAAAAIQVGGEVKWGYIDKSGDWVIEPRFDSVFPFSEGLAVVMRLEHDGAGNDFETFGYTDKTGTVVIPMQYSEVSGFRGGIAAVVFRDAHNGLPNYIDKTGKVIWQGR